jgi:hypothetical protein
MAGNRIKWILTHPDRKKKVPSFGTALLEHGIVL